MRPPALETERLLLRRWSEEDKPTLAAMVVDPAVSRYRAWPWTRGESDDLVDGAERSFDERGFGMWAVERRDERRLVGYAGLAVSDFDAPFCPAVDIGWTLARPEWGHGYATEAAAAVLDWAFGELQLDEVVAHTSGANEPSRAVMRRLGMTHDPTDDFDGPWHPPDHPFRRFVLYRMRSVDWRRARLTVGGPD